MAKNRTYLYIALGVLLLAIITSAFYFRTSSGKEGLKNLYSWKTYKNKDINGNNIITLPVKIKMDKLTKQRDAYLDINDTNGITKQFLRDSNLRTKHFRGKTCQTLCGNLDKCKSYVIDYGNKTCTIKNTKANSVNVDKSLVVKKKFNLKDSPSAAYSALKNSRTANALFKRAKRMFGKK